MYCGHETLNSTHFMIFHSLEVRVSTITVHMLSTLTQVRRFCGDHFWRPGMFVFATLAMQASSLAVDQWQNMNS